MSKMRSVALVFLLTGGGIMYGQGPRAEARVIMLTQYGFEPKQVTVKPGPVYFVLRSRLDGAGEEWQITETGKKNPKVVVPRRGKSVAREFHTMTPGDYEITVPRFPQWKCLVSVKP